MRFLLMFMLCWLSAACTPPETARPLRIAINPWPGYEFIYLAEQKGFFAQQGVAVTVLQMSGLTDVRRAFERGQVDGMACTIVEMLQVRELSARAPQIVFVSDYSNGGDVVMAVPAIQHIADLRGKRIAFEPGTLNLYLLSRALDKHQLTLDDVTLVPMAQSSMQEALIQKQVDALVSFPPTSAQLATQQLATTLFSTRDIPGEVLDVVIFDEAVITQRRDEIKKFLQALEQAYNFAEQHPDEAYAVMAKREGVTRDEFRRVLEQDIRLIGFEQQRAFLLDSGRVTESIAQVQKVLQRNGEMTGDYVPSSFVPDLRDLHGR